MRKRGKQMQGALQIVYHDMLKSTKARIMQSSNFFIGVITYRCDCYACEYH